MKWLRKYCFLFYISFCKRKDTFEKNVKYFFYVSYLQFQPGRVMWICSVFKMIKECCFNEIFYLSNFYTPVNKSSTCREKKKKKAFSTKNWMLKNCFFLFLSWPMPWPKWTRFKLCSGLHNAMINDNFHCIFYINGYFRPI